MRIPNFITITEIGEARFLETGVVIHGRGPKRKEALPFAEEFQFGSS